MSLWSEIWSLFFACIEILKSSARRYISFWVIVTRHAQSIQNKFAYLCNISINAWEMKLSFCVQINTKVFYKMVVSLWVWLARQAQSTKNNQLAIFLQYLMENMNDEIIFLSADKCWTFFSNWYYPFRCVWPGMSKLPKITSLLFLYKMLRKKWVMQLIFYRQICMKTCYKLILRFFDGYGQAFPKFPKKQVCNVFTISLKKLEGSQVINSKQYTDANVLGIYFFFLSSPCVFFFVNFHARYIKWDRIFF